MISEYVAHFAWYAALVLFGGLGFAPLWVAYGARRREEEIELFLRRRDRESRDR